MTDYGVTKMIDILESILVGINLSSNERLIYIDLFKNGLSTSQIISNRTNLPRTTLKENLDKLLLKGLIVSEDLNGTRIYSIKEIEDIQNIITVKKNTLVNEQIKLSSLSELVQSISSSFRKSYPLQFSVNLLIGRKELRSFYIGLTKYETVYSFVDLEKYYEVFPDSLNVLKRKIGVEKRVMYDIILDSAFAREKINQKLNQRSNTIYNVKRLPKEGDFKNFLSGDILIFEDKVAIIQLDSQNPSGILITSSLIANNLKAIHKVLWNLI